jgi:hypothetical protein
MFFVIFLAYKLELKGGELIKVPPRHTSQKCQNPRAPGAKMAGKHEANLNDWPLVMKITEA